MRRRTETEVKLTDMNAGKSTRTRQTIGTLSQAAIILTIFGQSQIAQAETIELVQDGKPTCSIVVSAEATPAARLAALELQFHLMRVSGAEIPIRTEKELVEGNRILIGESAATRQFGLRSRDFKPQDYLVAFKPKTIILIGRDWEDTPENRKVEGRLMAGDGATLQSQRYKLDYWKTVGLPERSAGEIEIPGIYDDQGTLLAAYDFLERYCGVRWYGPSDINIIFPSRKNLTAEGPDVRRSPALKHRTASFGSWPFTQGQYGNHTRDQVRLFSRRIRQGGERWGCNHTFYRQTIQAAFTDPEYQSKNPHSAGSQLCYTNPKLIDQVAQMARDFFDGKGTLPDGWKAVGDYFAIVPDDNINLCNCETCQALLDKGKDLKTGYFSSGEISDYWFSFVNAVARKVRETHPDKYIATLAYWAYAFPPDFDVEPNVSISPCLHTCYYSVSSGMRENDMKFYQGWQSKAKAPKFLWVYYHHPMEMALIQGWKCFPNVMVHETAKSMRMFIRDGYRGIFQCGEQDQLEQYVIAKVWDSPDADVDGLIDEFFRLYFGAAAEPMKKFYLRLEHIATDPSNCRGDFKGAAWKNLGTAERMQELGDLIAEAEKLAGTETEKQRVSMWRKAIWDWMCQGREQYLAEQAEKEK